MQSWESLVCRRATEPASARHYYYHAVVFNHHGVQMHMVLVFPLKTIFRIFYIFILCFHKL